MAENLDSIIESIKKLSVMELADLVHALEEEFGVSAAAPVAMASWRARSRAAGASSPRRSFCRKTT